jgi:multicomponent Na+:H+ antiporter subunit G
MFLIGGAMLVASPAAVMKCLICMVFLLVTSPTAAHALARGAHAFGVRLWEGSVVDKYAEDGQPGIVSEDKK